MKLIEFIKDISEKESPIGDLANDILGDGELPVQKDDCDIINYIEFKCSMGGTSEAVTELMLLFNENKTTESNSLNSKFLIAKSEMWEYTKENFKIFKVELSGLPDNIYKIRCIDQEGKSIKFELKGKIEFNSLAFTDSKDLLENSQNELYGIHDAIILLNQCNYAPKDKPNESTYNEVHKFLMLNT